ncbi:CD7 protein, partial [Anhinga anhinga]|nr:CD7 protein [Anhinga anhinga]
FLLKTHVQPERVLYVSSWNVSTIFPAFANRLEYSKQEKKIVITLHNLRKNDSDIYVCAGVKNSSSLSVSRSGTVMLIKGTILLLMDSQDVNGLLGQGLFKLCSELAVCFVLQMKKNFLKRKPNAVYEDMSYSSRRNTLIRN